MEKRPPREPEVLRPDAWTTARSAWRAHQVTIVRLIRYSAVSVVATTVSLITLGTLVGVAAMSAVAANLVATAVGTVPSFELNRRWVWKTGGRRSLVHQVLPFCALSFVGLAVSTVAVGLAGTSTASWSRLDHTVAVEAASIAAYGSLWVVQYTLLDRYLFRSRVCAEGPWTSPAESRESLATVAWGSPATFGIAPAVAGATSDPSLTATSVMAGTGAIRAGAHASPTGPGKQAAPPGA